MEMLEEFHMNYLVLDLEMCGVAKHYRTDKFHYATEIIQIGAVLLDEEYQRIAEIVCASSVWCNWQFHF